MTAPSSKWTSRIAILLVLVATALAARNVLLAPRDLAQGIFQTHTGHSWDYNVWRIVGLGLAWSSGDSGRWIADFAYGWGYPLFHFTGPLPYGFGAVFYALGLDANVSLNAVWLFGFFTAALLMYFAMGRIFGAWAGLLAAICYTFAPYHFVDSFVRTNLGEFIAF